jgi:hypothetical protein
MPRWGSGMLLLEQGPQKTFPQLRQWCLRLVKVKAVRHRMQTSESVHSGATTHGTAVQHAAGDVLFRWEVVAFALQAPVDLVDVA